MILLVSKFLESALFESEPFHNTSCRSCKHSYLKSSEIDGFSFSFSLFFTINKIHDKIIDKIHWW